MSAFLPFDQPATNEARDLAMAQVETNANTRQVGFSDAAKAFVVMYLTRYGPASGEVVTLACKRAGIRPHDDRAFGPVYMGLARARLIQKVGVCRRERGHGTAGGNIWALV